MTLIFLFDTKISINYDWMKMTVVKTNFNKPI